MNNHGRYRALLPGEPVRHGVRPKKSGVAAKFHGLWAPSADGASASIRQLSEKQSPYRPGTAAMTMQVNSSQYPKWQDDRSLYVPEVSKIRVATSEVQLPDSNAGDFAIFIDWVTDKGYTDGGKEGIFGQLTYPSTNNYISIYWWNGNPNGVVLLAIRHDGGATQYAWTPRWEYSEMGKGTHLRCLMRCVDGSIHLAVYNVTIDKLLVSTWVALASPLLQDYAYYTHYGLGGPYPNSHSSSWDTQLYPNILGLADEAITDEEEIELLLGGERALFEVFDPLRAPLYAPTASSATPLAPVNQILLMRQMMALG